MSETPGTHLEVRPLAVGDAPSCDQILLSLPRHFGKESGRAACAQAVRTSEGWIASLDGRVVGFLTVQPQNATTVEITWMAVHAERRGQGIGRRLIERLRQEMPNTKSAQHLHAQVHSGFRPHALYSAI